MHLLTREEFRDAVFKRDNYKCVICGLPAKDAHHIIERRLWPDGGYYEENGASLCEGCHLEAESTVLSCESIRVSAGIKTTLLPPHLYKDQRHDKWGNPILDDGTRMRGELFYDESVQKALKPVLHEFDVVRVKYPRTFHLPWSPGVTSDDRTLQHTDCFKGKVVVVTEKMDGENTTLYSDGLHARSTDYNPHPSRSWVRALQAKIGYNIPKGWRVCGENLYAKHSIKYENLEDYFLVFSIWNEDNVCLDWQQTVEWAELLGLKTVPVIRIGVFEESWCKTFRIDENTQEGYVIRLAGAFEFKDFKDCVAKWVRKSHVTTHGHWMRSRLELNNVR